MLAACLDGVANKEAVQARLSATKAREPRPAQRGSRQGLRKDIQGTQVARENRAGENPAKGPESLVAQTRERGRGQPLRQTTSITCR